MESSLLAHYRVIRQIGSGTYGAVKCKVQTVALHIPSGRKVAIKVIDKVTLKRKRAQDKVLCELEILKMCRSPHVVKL
jgi:serine/threonine protein kinase